MRRFAFIHVEAPTKEFIEANWERYTQLWNLDVPTTLKCAEYLKEIWKEVNSTSNRPLGPAIIRDILDLMICRSKDLTAPPDDVQKQILTDAVASNIVPQFEGLEKETLTVLKEILNKYCIPDRISASL